MIFSTKLSKFGKGKNLSAIMTDSNLISVYYFENGIVKKNIHIDQENIILSRENTQMGYSEVIPINQHFLISRIDKSIGIIKNA